MHLTEQQMSHVQKAVTTLVHEMLVKYFSENIKSAKALPKNSPYSAKAPPPAIAPVQTGPLSAKGFPPGPEIATVSRWHYEGLQGEVEKFRKEVERLNNLVKAQQEDREHETNKIVRLETELNIALENFKTLEKYDTALGGTLANERDLHNSTKHERDFLRKEVGRLDDVLAGFVAERDKLQILLVGADMDKANIGANLNKVNYALVDEVCENKSLRKANAMLSAQVEQLSRDLHESESKRNGNAI